MADDVEDAQDPTDPDADDPDADAPDADDPNRDGPGNGTPREDAGPEDVVDDPPRDEAQDDEAPPPQGDATTEPAQGPPPEPYYEEVTLADLAITLWDHRRAALAVLGIVLLTTITYSALATPTYEATATLVPTHEQATILAVLESDHYGAHVAETLGLVDTLGGGNPTEAGRALGKQVSVSTGSERVQGERRNVVRVTATASNPGRAAAVADAYVTTLDSTRGLLENVTFDKRWEQYYQESDKNVTRARANLSALVQGYTYYRPLDTASVPDEPVSPDWRLNLALGATLGMMLAFMTPFVLEAGKNVRAELRERRDV